MAKLDDIIVGLVALANGQLVGRIRLQKIVYLMDQKGLNSGATFVYHHYGPYAESVTDAIVDAKFWDRLKEDTEFRGADGAPYSVFTTSSAAPQRLGNLDAEAARALVSKLSSLNSTVLELAATIHWLVVVEKVSDWKSEIEKRKAGKTGAGRLSQAIDLLRELDLAPM